MDENTPGVNNGHVETFGTWEPFLQLVNNTGAVVTLDELLYDAATRGTPTVEIAYRYGTAGTFIPLVTTPVTSTFQSFAFDISSLELTDGQTIQFRFGGGSGGQFDNFGITAVPEPSGVLITAGLFGFIALLRRRA